MPGSAQAAVGDCVADAGWGVARPDLAGGVVDEVNAHRRGRGLAELTRSPTLTAAAEWKARHMAHLGYLGHADPAPPVSRTTGQRLEACGYPAAGWGENIAFGQPSPADAVRAWLGSPGHRANIERGSFRAAGVGVAANAGGRLYWAQAFGDRADGTPPAAAGPAAAPVPAPTPVAPTPTAPRPGVTPSPRRTPGAEDASPAAPGSEPRSARPCRRARSGGRVACWVRVDAGGRFRAVGARLVRGRRILARGRRDVRAGGTIVRVRLRSPRALHPGRYTLAVRFVAHTGATVTERQQVLVG